MDSKKLDVIMALLQEELSASKNLGETSKSQPIYITDSKSYIDNLKKCQRLLTEQNKFNVGDIVVWKEGLRNRRYPDYKQPAVVLQVYNEPISNEDPETDEDFDIKIGISIKNEDDDSDVFLAFNVNSNRFSSFVV